MKEVDYIAHCKQAKEAKNLYETLRELYGDKMDKMTLLKRARIDNMITTQEKWMLEEFGYGN